MTAKQFNIFLAAYFSDAEKIETLVFSEGDLEIYFDIPVGYDHGKQRAVRVSVMDILIMNRDCWCNLKTWEELKIESKINPSCIYTDTCALIKSLAEKYPLQKKNELAYEKFIGFLYTLEDEESWIDDDEFAQFVKEGYRQIDLQLINFAMKRNLHKVNQLLKEGANAMIDPEDKKSDSAILESLSSAESYYFLDYVSYYRQLIYEGIESFNLQSAYKMIASLYSVSSSARLYRAIVEY